MQKKYNKNYLIIGKKAVLDAMKNDYDLRKIYLQKRELKIFIEKRFWELTEINAFAFKNLNRYNHQGFFALVNDYRYVNEKTLIEEAKKILVLDHLEDPQNFGALLRSASAFGFDHIIFPLDRSAPLNLTVNKVSLGAVKDLSFHRTNSLQKTLVNLKKAGFWIYSSILDNDATRVDNAPFNEPLVLIIGNEQKGVSKTLSNLSDVKVYIPMDPKMQSLNASAAGAILMSWATLKSSK